jgi:hypothetical protein
MKEWQAQEAARLDEAWAARAAPRVIRAVPRRLVHREGKKQNAPESKPEHPFALPLAPQSNVLARFEFGQLAAPRNPGIKPTHIIKNDLCTHYIYAIILMEDQP